MRVTVLGMSTCSSSYSVTTPASQEQAAWEAAGGREVQLAGAAARAAAGTGVQGGGPLHAYQSCLRRRHRWPKRHWCGCRGTRAARARAHRQIQRSARRRRPGRSGASGCPGRRPGCAPPRPLWGCEAASVGAGQRCGRVTGWGWGPAWLTHGLVSAQPALDMSMHAPGRAAAEPHTPGACVIGLGAIGRGVNGMVHLPQAGAPAHVGAHAVGRHPHCVHAPQVKQHRPRLRCSACGMWHRQAGALQE